MAGTNILVRQKDLIAGAGISITPDATSGNVTIAATSTAIDESRLVPTGGKGGDILSYQEGADRGNGDNVRLLLQNAMTDSANGNAAPAAVTTQGVTLTGDNNLLFDGNDSHVTAVLATDEIFAADKEWTIDFWMKPTANSSEWNYILTENTGDWGSHSIGLTWNSDDSTLEQDTGGYLASVIRSSNWPNDAVACAADQWHFVVVEKQKTSTGWSLNYYLNGAIWLQVAFTGEFVPFTSDNPFWFGGKTTDSGRWFKGEVNKLRVTMGARYGSKAFAVPDRLTDYAAPAGQPVWTEGIDRSRLLPENPANGDIPCFDATATVGGGNDAHTKILLHFDADEIKDEAAGNAAPVTIKKKSGTITVVEGGKWGKCAKYVTGSMTVATNLDELNANNWVVSGWFNPDENNHGVSYPTWLSMDDQNTHGFGFDSTGRYGESDGPLFYLDTPPASGTWHWLAIVKYSGGLRFYLNGAFLNEISAQQRANFCSTLAIGGFAGTYAAGSTERTFSGLVDEVRLQYIPDDEITLWTGTSIAVPDAPYSKPQTVGEWGKFNKAELAMKSELTAALTGKVNQSELAAYQKKSEAFSGQYSDLAGKPSTFPPAAHTHTIANVTDLQATVNKAHEHANKAALDKISETGGKLAYGGTAVGGVSSWTELADKPSTFPPAAHSHTIANVTDLQTMLNSKAASAHGHAVADVTGLQSLLDGKAAVGHTHAAADVAGLATTLAGKVSSVNGLTPDDSGALVLPQATSGAAGLMAATDKAAIAGLTAYGIYPVAGSKTGAVDFNEVIDHGFYFIGGDTPHLNYPETYAQTGGTLQVIRAGAYLTQTFIPIVSQSMAFIRHCINVQSDLSGRTFSTWRRLLTDADITESKTRPGYFKLPGGMIVQWGKKTAITQDEENCYIAFPIAFPTMFLAATAIASSGTLSATGVIVSLSEVSTTSMTMVVKNHPNTGSPDMDQYIEIYWFAVGF